MNELTSNLTTNSSASEQFSWVGQFLGFAPGNKSPYQYLALQVVTASQDHGGKAIEIKGPHQVRLSKSLRRMLMGYLAPQDWIGVIGKTKVNAQTGDLQWRAREVVRLLPQQVRQYTRTAIANPLAETPPTETPQTVRVLICQKSSCRQRGSQAIEAAIAQTVQNRGSSTPSNIQLNIQPTGCMKQCKSGPHLVLIPPRQAAQHNAEQMNAEQMSAIQRYNRVTPTTATQIVEKLL